MAGRHQIKLLVYNDLRCFVTSAHQEIVSLPLLKRKMYPIHIGGFAFRERI